MTTPAILTVNNIEVIYDHVILVLKGVSLSVPRGKIVALMGANGAGKSTTLKSISTLLRGERGDGAGAVATQRGKGFQVGLDAGAAAAVGPGNGQNAGVLVGGWWCLHARHYQESAVAA